MPVLRCFCERSVKILYLNIIAIHTIATNDFFVVYATALELNVVWYAIYAGIWGIKNLREKKETHTWAIQVLNELVDHRNPDQYKYVYNGQDPRISTFGPDVNAFTA